MTTKPLEVRVPITELPMQVEKKSKQTDLNDTPKPMSLPINDLSYTRVVNLEDYFKDELCVGFVINAFK